MSCLNVIIKLADEESRPQIRCSLVCGVSMSEEDAFSWSDDVRLLWDDGTLIAIDK